MQHKILVYLLFAMAVVTVILAFKRYELQYNLVGYMKPDYNDKQIRKERFWDAFHTFMTILASAYTIKFRFFEIEEMLPWYVVIQIALLVATYKHISSIKRLIFARYFLEALERKSKGLEPAAPPWFGKDMSILNSIKRLDDELIKYMTEAVEDFKKSRTHK